MKILISNDDGVYAPGLIALANALSQIAEITVIAPDRNRSGASNSLTLDNPLRVKKLDNGFFYVEGTPTDCVHLAINNLLPEKPDMVVSGINAGANLGEDVFYSGTVAAAIEARFLTVPAIALSLVGTELQHYAAAAEIAKLLVLKLQEKPIPEKTILNINIPDIPFNEIRGFTSTRLGARHPAEPTIPTQDPRGEKIYWLGLVGSEADAGPGTDFYAVTQKQVSVTPLELDLTHYPLIAPLSKWLEEVGDFPGYTTQK